MTISTTAKAVRGGLLAASVLLAAAAQAQAAPRQPFQDSNYLYLTVTKGGIHSDSTLLLCDPPLGHRRAAEACAQLTAVEGDISRLPQKKDVFCPMIYAPVVVQARGEWGGHRVEYTQTFSSGCVMAARTGSVFALEG
ncbi:SSI family serine proteinase inhibitor [Streptomyces sp. NPDC047043]|uniref:SSI family serine proteinase inhibitor n=1 Tax=Streptomyces sp. NPDC047043 TaxID=3154497 RepID=UPI0033D4E9E6